MESRAERVKPYLESVTDLSAKLNLGEAWGPSLIHGFVAGRFTADSGEFRPSPVGTTPFRLTIHLQVAALTSYTHRETDLKAGIYALGQGLPSVRLFSDEEGSSIDLRVRNLQEAELCLRKIVRIVGDRSGLPTRKPRSDSLGQLQRNVQWWYLRKCESRSVKDIADEITDGADEDEIDIAPDEPVIRGGIKQVDHLLSLLRVT